MQDSLPNHCGVSLAELTQHLTPPVLRQDLSGQPDPLLSLLLQVSILVSIFLLIKFLMELYQGLEVLDSSPSSVTLYHVTSLGLSFNGKIITVWSYIPV